MISRPIASRRRLNRRRQNASLITATGWPPRLRLSSGVSTRPSCGATRSTPKNSPVTSCTRGALRLAAVTREARARDAAHRRQAVRRREAGAQLFEERIRDALRDRQTRYEARDVELFGLRHRQRLQQHRVGDREDRAVGADAGGERQHDDERETGIGAQHARAVADVLRSRRRVEAPARASRTCWVIAASRPSSIVAARRACSSDRPARIFSSTRMSKTALDFVIEVVIDAIAMARLRQRLRRRASMRAPIDIRYERAVWRRSYRMSIGRTVHGFKWFKAFRRSAY